MTFDSSRLRELLESERPSTALADFVDTLGERTQIANFLDEFRSADWTASQLEHFCPALLESIRRIVASPELCEALHEICFSACHRMAAERDSKLVRKSAVAALRILLGVEKERNGPFSEEMWENFVVLMDGLEEPQYHLIVPMLPRLNPLIKYASSLTNSEHSIQINRFSWTWLLLIFCKAFRHSNGWIRVWALEKVSQLRPIPADVEFQRFLLEIFFPALNDIDPFWRFIERNVLHTFVENTGQMLSKLLNSPLRADFLVSILDILFEDNNSWVGCPLYFLSQSFRLTINDNDHTLHFQPEHLIRWRPLFRQIGHIQFVPIRLTASLNFMAFLIQIYNLSSPIECWYLPRIVSKVPVNGLSQTEIAWLIQNIFKYFGTLNAEIILIGTSELVDTYLNECLSEEGDMYTDIWAQFIWSFARHLNSSNGLLDTIEAAIIDSLELDPDFQRVDCLVGLWTHQPGNMPSVDSFLEMLGQHLPARVLALSSSPSPRERQMALDPMMTAIELVDEKRKGSDVEPVSEALAHCTFALLRQLNERPFGEIETDALAPESRRTLLECATRSLEWLHSHSMHSARVHEMLEREGKSLWSSIFSGGRESPISGDDISVLTALLNPGHASNAVGWLDPEQQIGAHSVLTRIAESALSWTNFAQRKRAMQLVEILLAKSLAYSGADDELPLVLCLLLNTLFVLVREERKSRHFLPSVEHFLRIALHQHTLRIASGPSGGELFDRIQHCFDELLAQCQKNVPLSVVLARQLFRSREALICPSKWAPQLVALATFGPQIRRDTRVLYFVYRALSADLEMDMQSSLHMATHHTRMFALSTIMLLSARQAKKVDSEPGMEEPFVHSVLKEVVHKCEEWERNKSSSFGMSMSHRAKTRLSQLLVLLADFAESEQVRDLLFEHCVRCVLDTSQQYSIKLLVEWTLSRMCSRHEHMFTRFLELEKTLASKRVASICSWLNILLHQLPLHQSAPLPSLRLFFARVLPWTTAQNFSVRCTALAAIRVAWERNLARRAPRTEGVKGWLDEFSLIERIAQFDVKVSAGNGTRIVENLCSDFYFAHFCPLAHFSLETVLNIFPCKTGIPSDECIDLDTLRAHSESSFECNGFAEYFRSVECADRQFADAESLVYSHLTRSQNCAPAWTVSEPDALEGGKVGWVTHFEGEEAHSGTELQRKLNLVDTEKQKAKMGEEPQLIVVASLISKMANIGGICRTCEVFNVSQLCVSSAFILESADFKALSMSAENWLPIEQVKPTDLPVYLAQKRAQGYQIVAAEQTTRSVPLEKFQFARRTVLLLGDEKEGVTPELLRHVDSTVEITQLGRTRSLNVHVSAALCIHSFASQLLIK